MKITAIVAVDTKGAMGVENRLLCHLPDDLKFFKEKTLGKTVVMGRRTYESIGKPLPNRNNIILTRQDNYEVDKCIISHSIPECMDALKATKQGNEEVFIIGGASIFEQTISYWDKIIITVIDHEFKEADAFFPKFASLYMNSIDGWTSKKLISSHLSDNNHLYSYSVYEICRDRRFNGKQSQNQQFQLIYS